MIRSIVSTQRAVPAARVGIFFLSLTITVFFFSASLLAQSTGKGKLLKITATNITPDDTTAYYTLEAGHTGAVMNDFAEVFAVRYHGLYLPQPKIQPMIVTRRHYGPICGDYQNSYWLPPMYGISRKGNVGCAGPSIVRSDLGKRKLPTAQEIGCDSGLGSKSAKDYVLRLNSREDAIARYDCGGARRLYIWTKRTGLTQLLPPDGYTQIDTIHGFNSRREVLFSATAKDGHRSMFLLDSKRNRVHEIDKVILGDNKVTWQLSDRGEILGLFTKRNSQEVAIYNPKKKRTRSVRLPESWVDSHVYLLNKRRTVAGHARVPNSNGNGYNHTFFMIDRRGNPYELNSSMNEITGTLNLTEYSMSSLNNKDQVVLWRHYSSLKQEEGSLDRIVLVSASK